MDRRSASVFDAYEDEDIVILGDPNEVPSGSEVNVKGFGFSSIAASQRDGFGLDYDHTLPLATDGEDSYVFGPTAEVVTSNESEGEAQDAPSTEVVMLTREVQALTSLVEQLNDALEAQEETRAAEHDQYTRQVIHPTVICK